MNALELTQRQHELLENIAKAIQQYQQATADASARLEHEFEQIEQSCDKERQRIEEERKEKVKLEDKPELQQEIAARRSTITLPTGITTIETVKEEIKRTSSASPIKGCITIIVMIFLISIGLVFFGGLAMGQHFSVTEIVFISIFLGLLLWWRGGREAIKDHEKTFVANKIAYLHRLYDRWLELVDEQASAQRAEAQRRYDQTVAQAKGQMLAAAEQLRPAIAEFDALTEQVFPSWESKAWRRWEPESLVPGAVRLGVFTKMEV